MESVYLIKIGEIALKGKNRSFFENRLKKNIKARLKDVPTKLDGGHGRYFLSLTEDKNNQDYINQIENVLSTTFGIVAFAQTLKIEKDENSIFEAIYHLIDKLEKPFKTFKAESKRSDKKFHMNSMALNCLIGEKILTKYPKTVVDIHTPQQKIFVEIRDHAYVYLSPQKGPGGLPVGVAGRGTLLLSGGIDSPVAAYMMAKRGLKLDAVYFHAYPYTSDKAKEKVIELAKKIAPYNNGINLFVVPFTDVQMEIKKNGVPEQSTILMRCCMMEIADRITRQRDNKAIVTGEALSQVASQTTESIRVSGSHTDFPVLRPLIGMDKEEIILIARKIGTFETSILPYEDCCTLFSPKHPLIRPKFEALKKSYSKLEADKLMDIAIENAERFYNK